MKVDKFHKEAIERVGQLQMPPPPEDDYEYMEDTELFQKLKVVMEPIISEYFNENQDTDSYEVTQQVQKVISRLSEFVTWGLQ